MIKSIMLILLLGFLFSKMFEKIKLPGLLGMILVGILIGPYGLNYLDSGFLKISSEIRTLALIIILLRAGLGLDKEILKKVGKTAIKMSMIPCLCEGFLITFTASKMLNLPIIEAGMLGFIIAAVSPAVVVPSMLELKESGLGMDKGIPIIILAGSSIDDVFAITLFTAFLGMANNINKSVGVQIAHIPVEIIGGIILGLLVGIILHKVFQSLKLKELEQLAILFGTALIVKLIGDKIGVAGLLSIMTMGFVLLQRSCNIAVKLEKKLNKMWFFAQIFLFVLIGAAVNTQVALDAGALGLIVIVVGLIGRTIGVIISLIGSDLNFKEKLFCAIAYSPKATVQAAIGGVPLVAGISSGSVILAIAVLAILFTAPLGLIGIKTFAPRLLKKEEDIIEKTV
ncbi:cation:proton antiporter [Clostridium aestuarii]|uniref:Cation:proton antiporter n=1 Tax=Clostridium aestuarii TaxID=338193 RepID=A0ABT4CZ98_9CLOT|nr:cation:proton antiporter [Clostridium aestuarii]MCY6484307.1 cation:proton antiporter [Clostridium aestuarii]